MRKNWKRGKENGLLAGVGIREKEQEKDYKKGRKKKINGKLKVQG